MVRDSPVTGLLPPALLPRPSLANMHIRTPLLSYQDQTQLQSAWSLISEQAKESYMMAKKADQSVSTQDFLLLKPPKRNKFGEVTYHDIRNAWVNEPLVHYYLICCISLLPTQKKYAVLTTTQTRGLLYGGASTNVINTKAFFNLDVMLIPIHNEKHWSLIAMLPKERLVKYFDSCGRTNHQHLQAVKAYAGYLNEKFRQSNHKPWKAKPCPWRIMKQRNGENKRPFTLTVSTWPLTISYMFF